MFWILSAIFILLNVFDVWLTRRALKKGAVELNPIARKFGLYLPKLASVLVIGLAYFTAWWVLVIPVAIMIVLTIHNITEYKKLEG